MPPSADLLFVRERPSTLPRLDRDSSLHRIRAGAYVDRARWDSLKPWERYDLRVRAVARTWASPVFCLESAAAIQGLPIFGEPRFIHLFAADKTSWRQGDVIVHGSADSRDVVDVDRLLCTSVKDTATDLGRVLPPAFALTVADHAARTCSAELRLDVSALGRSQVNRRGLRQLDWVQERIDVRSESAGESVSRAVLEWLGYEAPETQVTFTYEGVTDRSDFYWRGQRAIGESDGYGKYDAADAEAMKAILIAEKRREERLRRYESGFARWDWKDAMTWRPLDRALRSAGLVPVRAADARLLATLATNPRSLSRRLPRVR
jgi:hypothetical protein